MAIDLQALWTELSTDPKGVGYAEHVASGADNALADLLNSTRVDGDTCSVGVVPTVAAFLMFDPAEWAALTPGWLDWWRQLGASGTIDFGNATVVARIGQALQSTNCPNTLAAFKQSSARPCTRSEALFGAGIAVDHLDIAAARRVGAGA